MKRALQNKDGTAVDPVPFLVVSLLAFTAVYSFGPIYLTELGVPLRPALALCTATVAVTTAGAYHRYVWTARPDHRAIVPVEHRLKRLIYGMLLVIGLIALLSLPLLVT